MITLLGTKMERRYSLCFSIVFIVEILLLFFSKNLQTASEQYAIIVISATVPFIALLFITIFGGPQGPSATEAVFVKPIETKSSIARPPESTPQKIQPQPTSTTQVALPEGKPRFQRTDIISPAHPDSTRALLKEGVTPPSTGEPYRPPPVPTIIPAGLIKPPSSAPTEHFREIVPQRLAAPSPEMSRRRTLESIVPAELDYKELAERARGIKLSLLGWWPIGWSRVTLDSGAAPQFWRFDKGKLVAGVLVGFDYDRGEYIVWTAESAGGVFKNIRESARCGSEEEVMARAKALMKEMRSSST